MQTAKIVATAAALAIAVGLVWGVWSIRSHGFSAREKPAPYETYLARRLRSLASEPGAKDLKNPIEATPLTVAEARDHFADHCATCHGNQGDGKTQISTGLYPPAPDMRTGETQDLSDGELFYIIKNGIRFTGMPGWGGSDEDNWKLVLFIRHLPKIQPVEIEFMDEINHLGSGGQEH
ncbi:MAG: c-type cytochrome [Bryobacteraceae bacterium]